MYSCILHSGLIQYTWVGSSIEGSYVIISKNNCIILFLKIVFDLANSENPDDNAASCRISSGSSLFAKVRILKSPVYKGLQCTPVLRAVNVRGFEGRFCVWYYTQKQYCYQADCLSNVTIK